MDNKKEKNPAHDWPTYIEQAKKTGSTVIAATHDARIKDRFETILEMTA